MVARLIIPRTPVPVVGTILVLDRTACVLLLVRVLLPRRGGLDLRFKVGFHVEALDHLDGGRTPLVCGCALEARPWDVNWPRI